jgi:hypothetical protein
MKTISFFQEFEYWFPWLYVVGRGQVDYVTNSQDVFFFVLAWFVEVLG